MKIITIHRERVSLVRAAEIRGWRAHQGESVYEFRPSTTERWLVWQRLTSAPPNTARVVGRGKTLQRAADDAGRTPEREVEYVPETPRGRSGGRDLLTTSLDGLVLTLGRATRLGYDDERAGHERRTAPVIAESLYLARWNGTQVYHLVQAYKAGWEFSEIQRRYASDPAATARAAAACCGLSGSTT